ncbi:MAG: hypothetical protein QOK05_2355 [Chloroflexota bacterium]|nr:hypothetical protein [Chloroflexota bacterium]
MKFSIVRSARLAALAALMTSGIAIAQPMSTSAAAPLAAAITCNTSLTFPAPSGGNSSCNGSATGIANGSPAALQAFTSNFSYTEPCPPVIGTAAGTYASGSAGGSFTWTRVGLTAVLVLHPNGGTAGAAAALFLPLGVTPGELGPTACTSGTVNATVVALGAGA